MKSLVSQDKKPTPPSNQRKRSVALAWSLVFLAVLFFSITIVKLGGQVALRSSF